MKTLLLIMVILAFGSYSTKAQTTRSSPPPVPHAMVHHKTGTIVIEDTTLKIGMLADDFVKTLGEPDFDDGGNGKRVISYQKSKGILADAQDGKIIHITLFQRQGFSETGLNLKTAEGLTPTSSWKDVIDIYGKPASAEDVGGFAYLSYSTIHFVIDQRHVFSVMISNSD